MNKQKHPIRTTSLGILLGGALVLAGCSGESTQGLMEQAQKAVAANDSKAAVIQLKNVLQKDPKQVEARFLLGKLLLEGGDSAGAAIELQKARELGYEQEKLIPLLAKAKLQSGEADKVITDFATTKLSNPAAQADLLVTLSNAYRARGRLPDARNAVKEALALQPANVAAQLLLIRTMASDKDFDGANERMDALLAAAPRSSEAYQLKAELLQFKGDADGALASYKQAIALDKRNVAAHSGVLWMLVAKKDQVGLETQLQALREAEPQHPLVKFFTGMLALDKGDVDKANEQAQALLKQAPGNLQALQLAGTVELRKGALVQAEDHLGRALQLAPGNVRIRLLLAQAQLRGGDPAKTVKTLQPLVDTSSARWEPTAMMAQALLMAGEPDKAESYFAKAAKLNPADARSRTALALAQMSKGQAQEGFDELRHIAQVDPGPTADLAIINALLRKKDTEGALAAIAKLEKKLPGKPLPSFLRGQAELQRGRYAQARTAFEAALATAPTFFPAAAGLASVDAAEGKPELARDRFAKLFEADSRNVRAGMAWVRASSQAGAKPEELVPQLAKVIKANPGEAVPRLALVSMHLDLKQYKSAQAAAQEALAAIPDNPELLDLLGQAQFQGGELNQALTTYNKLVSLRPQSVQPLMRLAELHRASKDDAAAIQDLKRALAIKPDYQPALRALMGLEMAAGRDAAALAVARSAQTKSGGEASGLVLEGDLAATKKDWAAAAKAYRASLAKRPGSEAAVKLHQVLLAGQQADEAQKFEQQWLKQYPNDAIFLLRMGDAALSKSDFERAQQYYAAVVKLQPEQTLALNNLAWLLNKAKKPDALSYAQRAVKLAPQEPAFQDTLAQIYADNGQLPLAVETQKKALALRPELHLHRLHLAQLYLAAGDKAQAKAELTQLAALGDKFSGQTEVKAMLAKL